MKRDIGIIGLAVMGKNLAWNMADHGYYVSGFNRSFEVTKQMEETHPHDHFKGYETMETFVDSLRSPKKIMLMVKAGETIDAVLAQVLPLLDKGDMIFDGGNSFFQDTIRREKMLKEKGILYFGVGISGGEQGARNGPSIMPGGDHEAYLQVRDIFESIAAKANDGSPCCTYIGENGAGHYVKMVHNGIEYADMQMIAEAYLLLKHLGQYTNKEIAQIFQDCEDGVLSSYLIRITAHILREQDDMAKGDLIDKIKDASAQKGTGKWTSEEAISQGVDVSMITAAYLARLTSAGKTRMLFQKQARDTSISIDKSVFVEQVKDGMYAAKMIAYAQGFALLHQASQTYKWNLAYDQIASIFRAGCIIQARFLDDIMFAYQKSNQLPHLLADSFFYEGVMKHEQSLRVIVSQAIINGIPIPAFANAISYLDSLQASHVGANLIQAQRDYFGAHTYERTDVEGSYHHHWSPES